MRAQPQQAAESTGPLKAWLERDGALLRLRLARPKANIIDAQMVAALAGCLSLHEKSKGMLAVLLDHEGPHFSFGASVEEHLPENCAAMLSGLHALLGTMLEWRQPILVAIRGQCLGGGLELAMAGHLLFVAPDAQLGQPEIKLGVFPPAASVLLPLRIAQARAEDLLYSGRSIDGATAAAWGLANQAAEDPAAAALAYFDAHLADKSASSVAHGVRAARSAFADLARARLAEAEESYLNDLMETRDANEGLAAFLAKRRPAWEHR
jgi:cyclohexa-1,5-dienecarbonyl-CoA hydratase